MHYAPRVYIILYYLNIANSFLRRRRRRRRRR